MFIDCFPILIYKNKINVDLKKSILLTKKEIKKDKIGVKLSNNGGYQSKVLNFKKVKFLFDKINAPVSEYCKKINFKGELIYANSWVNVNLKKDFNRLHDHPHSFLSGVLYFKVPKKSGRIVFENPAWWLRSFWPHEAFKTRGIYTSGEWVFDVEESMLILFPSFLRHYVEPNETNEERISFSFNLSFKK
tara:strand:- start:638 stop:1207 length:570 start_codon:yes stop_codon:yes gene_type:complete